MKSRIAKEKFAWPDGLTEETLRNERNFLNYVRLLKSFAKKYCVIIAVNNTPYCDAITPDITSEIMNIGLKINLYYMHTYPYAAVIDEGNLLYEKLGSSKFNVIEERVTLDITKDRIDVISAGCNAPNGNKGIIKINGINYSPDIEGYNFVVYDKFSKKVIDAVAFRTTIIEDRVIKGKIKLSFSPGSSLPAANFEETDKEFEMVLGERPADTYDMLEKYMRAHPDVIVMEYRIPLFPTSNLTENERFIKSNDVHFNDIKYNLGKHLYAISRYYDDEAEKEIVNVKYSSYIDNVGARRFVDVQGKYVNIAGGHRITLHQPVYDSENITIFMFGPCQIFSVGSSDEHTVTSYLQKIVNELAPQYKITVQNYGFLLEKLRDEYRGTDSWMFKTLNSFPVKPGDIVMYYNEGLYENNNILPQIDMRNAANAPRDYEVFFDHVHYTPDGNKLVAKKLYEGLVDQGILDKARSLVSKRGNDSRAASNAFDFDQNISEMLAEYKHFLTDFYNTTLNQPTGAVVMNCNPFTCGHRYLIEKALEQCSYLIVFLVEEDKSEFTFEERLMLADEGTKDIPNLAIIPSGIFILSSLTFSEYFNKSEMQDRIVDTSLDLTVFSREIAPCLNITKRFAGEEPFDNVTKQYNDAMRRILPEYGIEFVEIPRVELDSKPISASRVRELAKSGRFSELEELVPKTTLDYLIEKYKT
ncbi:MAG: adenylyltransferase/cytidyltransferase family protein [Oscillospiraceae bacterium]|nr:adenylyltransferase/cytidyltransferase family protein [Oscillospiraceae bacterium]